VTKEKMNQGKGRQFGFRPFGDLVRLPVNFAHGREAIEWVQARRSKAGLFRTLVDLAMGLEEVGLDVENPQDREELLKAAAKFGRARQP
jgi:hypothetical protein